MADGFGLDGLREGVKKRSAELSEDARTRSLDGSDMEIDKPFTFEEDDHDRTEAPKDEMRKYWRQFENTPIVRKPIAAFASRVTEPGYYIESEGLSEDQIRELGRWLDSCAIIEGQPGKDFRLLAKKVIIQREVRGTALVEKAPHKDDEDKVAGLKLINPETCEAVTRPNQNILMAPDDLDRFEDAPEAESGGAAAWLQDVLETEEAYWGQPVSGVDKDDTKIGFRRDEIIPLTRDADVGEVFGTSRIEAVSDRIDGIKRKLEDNDKAISSKAYPLWLFMFGTEEEPWDSSDIQSFMNAHEMENFHPGMKQGVRGDVEVDTISGEVADIADYLEFDIQWIMSVMPMPMFVLGSFGRTLAGAQFQGIAQQQDVIRQIEESRRELEQEFTPLIKEIAEQKGFDEEAIEDLRLRFGEPGAPDPEVRRSQQTIRYISDANDSQDPQQPGPARPGTGQRPPTMQPQAGSPTEGAEGAAATADLWAANSMEELQSAVDINENRKESLSGDVSELFLSVRDRVLNKVGDRYTTRSGAVIESFGRISNQALDRGVNGVNLRRRSREILREEMEDVSREYGNDAGRFAYNQSAFFFSRNVVNAARDAAEEMLRRARVHVRNGVASDERWSEVRERIEEEFNRDRLEKRADIIAHMELKKAVETAKLQEFEASEDIIGVRVSNPDASTPITQSLHGAEAYFSAEEDIDEQLAEQADSDALRKGFEPLPRTPPYHFNDTTSLEPIYADEANLE